MVRGNGRERPRGAHRRALRGVTHGALHTGIRWCQAKPARRSQRASGLVLRRRARRSGGLRSGSLHRREARRAPLEPDASAAADVSPARPVGRVAADPRMAHAAPRLVVVVGVVKRSASKTARRTITQCAVALSTSRKRPSLQAIMWRPMNARVHRADQPFRPVALIDQAELQARVAAGRHPVGS